MEEDYTTPTNRAIESPVLLSQRELFALFLEAPMHTGTASSLIDTSSVKTTPRDLAGDCSIFEAGCWAEIGQTAWDLPEALLDAVANNQEPGNELNLLIGDVENLLDFLRKLSREFHLLCSATETEDAEAVSSIEEDARMDSSPRYALPSAIAEAEAA